MQGLWHSMSLHLKSLNNSDKETRYKEQVIKSRKCSNLVSKFDAIERFKITILCSWCYRPRGRVELVDLQHERGLDGVAQFDHQQRTNVQTGENSNVEPNFNRVLIFDFIHIDPFPDFEIELEISRSET